MLIRTVEINPWYQHPILSLSKEILLTELSPLDQGVDLYNVLPTKWGIGEHYGLSGGDD